MAEPRNVYPLPCTACGMAELDCISLILTSVNGEPEECCPRCDHEADTVSGRVSIRSRACICGHDPAHHDKRKSVYAGLMADYRVIWACGWTGCGCPRFVQAAAADARSGR